MKVLLEIFVVTPETDDQIGYRRREFDISEDPRDPDELVHAALSDPDGGLPPLDIGRCLVHSTSWRHAGAGILVLTYLVYGEWIDFAGVARECLRLSAEGQTPGGTATRPRPRQIDACDVVRHGMRHIGHLVQRRASCVSPSWLGERSRTLFAALEPEVAGRIRSESGDPGGVASVG